MRRVLLGGAGAAALSRLPMRLQVGQRRHTAFLSACLRALVCGILIKICCHPGCSYKVACVVFAFPVVVFLWF